MHIAIDTAHRHCSGVLIVLKKRDWQLMHVWKRIAFIIRITGNSAMGRTLTIHQAHRHHQLQ
jgi:hypothetical protein